MNPLPQQGNSSQDPLIQWEPVPRCPVCDSPGDYHQPFSEVLDEGFLLRYVRCDVCGLVFQNPRSNENSRRSYYQDHYHREKMPTSNDIDRNQWVQEQRADYFITFSRTTVGDIRNHLDIGASRGLIMKAFIQAFECMSYGIEPGEKLRQQTLDEGMIVYPDLRDLPEGLRNTMDLITISHTLEHLEKPREFLAELKRNWLTPDGFILAEVPNLYWHQSLEFSHLTAFTGFSLDSMASQSGLVNKRLVHHGMPYSSRLPLFLLVAMMANDEQEASLGAVPPLIWMRFRRWLGLRVHGLFQLAASIIFPRRLMHPWRQ
jgi:hypothetical protein